MTSLLKLIAAGIMGLALVACGEGSKKTEDTKSTTVVTESQDNSEVKSAPADEQEPAAKETTPAQETPADEATEQKTEADKDATAPAEQQ